MARYIDVEKLYVDCVNFPTKIDLRLLRRIILRQPTADVVEVVRCEDCKHGEKTTQFRTDCTTKCILHNKTMIDNDFCSYGERRDT